MTRSGTGLWSATSPLSPRLLESSRPMAAPSQSNKPERCSAWSGATALTLPTFLYWPSGFGGLSSSAWPGRILTSAPASSPFVSRSRSANHPRQRTAVGLGHGVIELSPLKTGSKGRRTLELTPEILKMLDGHRSRQKQERARAGGLWRESGLIFTTAVGAAVEPSSFSHAFSRMAERAGLGRWHVHEARHTAASLMLAMGTKIEIVSRVLGHSSVTVTADVYSHLLGGEKRAAAAAMTSALLGPD
jgi:hypothetical protein